jgi:acyl-CoA synthetase (AMP-forming)/AMP-acid ligase II
MHIYRAKQQITIPENVNLTELLHTSSNNALPLNHVIAADNLEDRQVTIGQLHDTAGRLAKGLKAAYKPRDQSRWAILLPNGVAFIEAVHAVLWLDGVFCPINLDLQPAEIGHALSVGKVDYAIVFHETLSKVLRAFKTAQESNLTFKQPQIVVALGTIPGYKSLHKDFLAPERLPIPRHSDTKKRLASIHLSSGTTGNDNINTMVQVLD